LKILHRAAFFAKLLFALLEVIIQHSIELSISVTS